MDPERLTPVPRAPRGRRRLVALAALTAVAAALVGLTVLPAAPASAAGPRVTVANPSGDPVADPRYATTLTVHGTGFQSIKGGFGGIYVLFGTVKGTWQPSKGGVAGAGYLYVPDSQTKSNHGFEKFVTFPGGDTASSANGGVLGADGSWSTTLAVPGATFTALDRDNRATTVDCRKVTCGVITVGAHGVANSHNETFTPVRFESLYGGSPSAGSSVAGTTSAGSADAGAGDGATSAPATGGSAVTDSSAPAAATSPAAATGTPRVAVDRATAVLGRVLSFTATGLRPGEQATASLDDGLAAVGPLTAGPSGEIAGVLQLPRDLGAGTHALKVTGAASGAHPSVDFPVSAGTAGQDAEAPATGVSGHHRSWPPYVYLAATLVLLTAAIAFALSRRRRPSSVEATHG